MTVSGCARVQGKAVSRYRSTRMKLALPSGAPYASMVAALVRTSISTTRAWSTDVGPSGDELEGVAQDGWAVVAEGGSTARIRMPSAAHEGA